MLSILLLPFLAAAVIPYELLTGLTAVDSRWGTGTVFVWLPRAAGMIFIAAGLVLFCWCVGLFVRIGKGTLAPWDPARNLVAAGPYRFVRNPMISGVALMLAGQSLFMGSWTVGLWTCVFAGMNHLYFVYSEEPGLEQRFGENYRLYKAGVPRWIPRIRQRKGA